jgi:hypothetical protein
MFSLSTLEVACNPAFPGFALTERKQPDTWRWAIISAEGSILEEGLERTETDAKRTAVEALQYVTV